MFKSKRSVRELRRLHFLGQIAESIFTIEDLAGILDVLHTSLNEIIPSDKIFFFLHDEEKQRFILPAQYNDFAATAGGMAGKSLNYRETKLSSLLSVRKPIIRNTRDEMMRYSENELEIWGSDVAIDMSTPICNEHGKLIGILNFARTKAVQFNSFQRTLAMTAAGLLGKIVERDTFKDAVKQQKIISEWWKNSFNIILKHAVQPTCLIDLSNETIVTANSAFSKTFNNQTLQQDSVCISSIFGRDILQSKLPNPLPNEHKTTFVNPQNNKKYNLQLLSLGTASGYALLKISSSGRRSKRRHQLLKWSAQINEILLRLQAEKEGKDFMAGLANALTAAGELLQAQFVTYCRATSGQVDVSFSKALLPASDGNIFHQLLDSFCEITYGTLLNFSQMKVINFDQDSEKFQKALPVIRQLQIEQCLVIPLHGPAADFGVINFYFKKPLQLSGYQLKIVRNFFSQLQNIIENRNLTARLTQTVKLHDLLQHITDKVDSNTTTSAYIHLITQKFADIFAFDVACITLFDSEKLGEKRYFIASDKFQKAVKIKNWKAFIEKAQARNFHNIEARQELGGFSDLKSKLRDYIILGDRCIGVIEVGHFEEMVYSELEVENIKDLASHIATIFRGIRSYQRAKNRLQALSSMTHRSISVDDEQSFHETLSEMATGAKSMLGASQAALFLFRQDKTEVIGKSRLEKIIDYLPQFNETVKIKRQIYEVKHLEKVANKPKFYGTCIFLPIVVEDQVAAALGLSWDESYRISQWEIELLNIMATLFSNVLHNDRLRRTKDEHTDKLIRANTELENFVYTVSHDLKSPVVSIQGFVSILIDEYSDLLDTDARHYLDRIQRNSVQMEQLLRALLELSRVDRAPAKFTLVDGNIPIERALVEFSFQLKSKKIQIIVQENLPNIYCDVIRITQVFSNILGNAIKFRDPKKTETIIEIGAKTGDNYITFFVQDNGLGVAGNHLKSVFTMFKRHTRYHSIDGTGIGLTIAKRIVENHHGEIWMESEVGVGSKISFTLPLKKSSSITTIQKAK